MVLCIYHLYVVDVICLQQTNQCAVSWMGKVDPNGRLKRLPQLYSPNHIAMDM